MFGDLISFDPLNYAFKCQQIHNKLYNVQMAHFFQNPRVKVTSKINPHNCFMQAMNKMRSQCLNVLYRKVSLMEDSDQNIHLKNLSVHQAANEEEALNLLFLGDTNRMIAEVRLKFFIVVLFYCLCRMTSYYQGTIKSNKPREKLDNLFVSFV